MKKITSNFKTNTLFKLLLVFSLFFLMPQQSEAQFFKKLAKKAKEKIDKEAEKRSEKRVNKKIDKTFDDAEDVLDGKKKEDKEEERKKNEKGASNSESVNSDEANAKSNKPTVVWSKFDFVPGDTVIFEDGQSVDEENGEFPSRWDLYKGSAEIAQVNGENVIMFLDSGGDIIPYLKNATEDYLPEVFTIEFDVWFEKGQTTSNRFFISFRDKKNQRGKGLGGNFTIYPNGIEFKETDKRYPGTEALNWSEEPIGQWRHISIAYTKGKFKAYMDDTRLVNIPHLEGNPWGFTIRSQKGNQYLRNFRIAKGGVKYYDRVLSEGKIIVNGIKFDVNKATLKAESMGPINKIYQLMEKNPELNFSVEGHTDTDGGDEANMTLSKARGKSVMDKLIAMEISSNRLKSNGFGESKPLDNNSTPEGKANNRRVEFVKFTGKSSTNSNTSNSNTNNNSAFNEIDKKTIAIKLESLPESINIPISNNSGIVNGKGTIMLFATSDGNLGKMEVLDVDENNNHKLSIKYVTYNYNGSVHSQSNHLEIQGTYTCDLDKGKTEDVISSERDFHLGIQDSKTATLYPGETAILKILN
ncbi:MAG: OmpA family protein [Lutibacter sp.]|uniref:OmpA family protein n=1 Tax=Lutibacter sp. TaxID=1925666 RepID=UPI001A0EBC78|nr:OmpA family protein [Lutibacter sp.]NOR26955.1 OmpA family protein [Lutibacter sp.]